MKRWRRPLSAVLALGFIALNLVAFVQARAMTHYSEGGVRTGKPEALSPPEKLWAIVAGVSVPRPQNIYTPRDAGLSFETRRIPFPDGTYLVAWFVAAERSPATVLMFPGYAESKDSMLAQAAALHSSGYSVLLTDFRGAGDSSGSSTTLGWGEAMDVAQAADYARSAWPGQPIVLYGVSMGSAAVLRSVAAEGVRPAAVILESPFNSLLDTVGNRFHAMGLPAAPGSQLVLFWGSVQSGFNGFTHNPVDYAAAVHCPTLVLHGDHDPRVSLAEATSVYNHLAGPRQLVIFAGAGHESLITADPAMWKSKVARFLDSLPIR